ncbi:single stranded DNA-binding protein [Blastomonas natatoria]|uniref:Single-stranded DNA-binding protein n=1 Tax=Blastomonas natatoria TaxID=34015 RepID=A0A2V3UQL1_9SPHN|nr:single stranded DNA-binding protein [Blastomonas natatoria]
MKNTVTLVGFVGNTPETRQTQSGAKITTVSLVTTRSFKDSENNRQTETEWHRITCFNGIGKCVADYVAKGAMIMVTGRIHYTRWTEKRYRTVRLRDHCRAGRFPGQGQGSRSGRSGKEAALKVAPPAFFACQNEDPCRCGGRDFSHA